MSTTFPTTLQDLDASRGTANQTLSSPSHVTHHNTEDDTIEALQAKVGIDTSAVATSLDYIAKNAASNGGGHVQTAATGGTSQTTYTKGDILVATGSTTLTKLAVGSNNQVLVADSAQSSGVKWGGSVHTEQVFTASGTWTRPTGCTYIIAEGVGGGGSGGSTAQGGGSGGGAAGGYCRKVIDVTAISSVTVTIGAGGTPGAAGNISGGNGGDTTFGSHFTAGLGSGGGGGTGPTAGGDGGTGTSGDVNITGGDGTYGTMVFNTSTSTSGGIGGDGGASYFGGGGRGGVCGNGSNTAQGRAGKAYGSGGGGCASGNTGGNVAPGGGGTAGVIIVTEFYT